MISLTHPNIILIGANGFVNYGEKNALHRIIGINTVMDSGKNDGAIVAYKNGIEVYRRQYYFKIKRNEILYSFFKLSDYFL